MSTTCRSVTYSVLRRLVIHLYSFFIHMRCTPRVHAQGNELGLTWYKFARYRNYAGPNYASFDPASSVLQPQRRNYVALASVLAFVESLSCPDTEIMPTGIVPYSARRIIRVRDLRPKLCPFESKSQVRRPNLFHSNAETMLVFLVEWHRPFTFLKFKFNLFSSLVDVEGSFDIEYVLRFVTISLVRSSIQVPFFFFLCFDARPARCALRPFRIRVFFVFAVNRFPTNERCSVLARSFVFQFILLTQTPQRGASDLKMK
ncbi:hypothetical protein R3P38DRAFT_2774428 [Favolaschia claudopus]|uniref:Secreted protein n=1 Tax=Favolaschia claudopus TaxID=2862362 RepID=A0AAW0C177_9AGAR